MSRIRLIMLSLLAAFAVSAIGSASASAAFCEPDKAPATDYAVCVQTGENPLKTAEYEGVLENENHAVASTFESEVGGLPVEIDGTTAVATLKAEDSGLSTGKIKFSGLTVVSPEHCTVPEITAEFTDKLSTPPAAITDTFTGSGPLETFAVIEFQNKPGDPIECPIKAKPLKIKGKQKTTFDAGIGTLIEHHELFAFETGSELKLGAIKAEFEATFKELEPTSDTGFENWGILES